MKINKLQHDKLTELMANISNFSVQYGSIENILIIFYYNDENPHLIYNFFSPLYGVIRQTKYAKIKIYNVLTIYFF